MKLHSIREVKKHKYVLPGLALAEGTYDGFGAKCCVDLGEGFEEFETIEENVDDENNGGE